MPLNMFYNTGITTYVWVLPNRKPEHRKGKVKLIDATQWFQPLRKKLGANIARISDTLVSFEETEQRKIFDNAALGHWEVTGEMPVRIQGNDPNRA